jgi:hypothetical protein
MKIVVLGIFVFSHLPLSVAVGIGIVDRRLRVIDFQASFI